MKGLVSIVMPVYNRKNAFLKALLSIHEQTYTNYELIVVDDGSTEFSVVEMELPLEATIISQNNKGAQAARNAGRKIATGEYIIFWDADTIANDEFLEKMVHMLEVNPEASYVYCNFVWGKKKFASEKFDAEKLKKTNYITMTTLIRREHVLPLDESIRKFQDWDLWLTLLEEGHKGIWIDEYLLNVITGGTISSWLPKFAYKKPWKWLPGIRKKVQVYEKRKKIIQKKHLNI